MGVDAAQPLEPAPSPPVAAEVGDEDLLVVPHDGKADLTLAVDNDSYLAFDFLGKLGEVAGQFGGDDLLGGGPAAVDTLQALYLACLESVGIAVYLLNRFPRDG